MRHYAIPRQFSLVPRPLLAHSACWVVKLSPSLILHITKYNPYSLFLPSDNVKWFLEMPLSLTVLEDPLELRGGRSYPVTASFTNPLKKNLTNVVFHVEGARLLPATELKGK